MLRFAHAVQIALPLSSTSVHHTPSSGHRGPVTAAVASEDGSWLYTASKDGSIIKWDLRAILGPSTSSSTARITKAVYFPKKTPEAKMDSEAAAKSVEKGKGKAEETGGHAGEVLTLALSFDGTVLASGGKDKVVGVWNVEGEGGKWTRGLGGHKDKVAVRPCSLATSLIQPVRRIPSRNLSTVFLLVRPYPEAVRPRDSILRRDTVRASRLDPARQRTPGRGRRERRRPRQDDPFLESDGGEPAGLPWWSRESDPERAGRRDGG